MFRVLSPHKNRAEIVDFTKDSAIYLQIALFIEEQILAERWPERIPAIRDLAAQLRVNPNTVARTYAHLEKQGIINMQRGIGYFVAESAKVHILALRKSDFIEKTLPEIFKNMALLGVTLEEFVALYKHHQA